MIAARFACHCTVEPLLSDFQTDSKDSARVAPWLLLAGAAVGLALATWGLLETRSEAQRLSDEIVAVVGDRTIRLVDYRRVLAGVESDLRNPVDDETRRRVLDRMIDEELLVQRALDLGLAVIDRRVRGELTSGLIDSIVNEADAEEPDADQVERHYAENVDFFTRPGRLRAETIYFSGRRADDDARPSAAERAQRASERLAAARRDPSLDERAAVAAIEAELGDPQVSSVPDALLPATKLRDYVGPTVLAALDGLEVGTWSAPIDSGGGLYLARLVEREPPIVPELTEIEPLVRQDLKRRRGDLALRRYLDDLRSQIPVSINDAVLPGRSG